MTMHWHKVKCFSGTKEFGHSYIEQHWSDKLNVFNREHLNPFLNYHRPCYFPTIVTDDKGKQRKKYHYDKMMTPYEKLKLLDNAKDYLKESLSFEQLDKEAYKIWIIKPQKNEPC